MKKKKYVKNFLIFIYGLPMYCFYMDNARKTPLRSEEIEGEKIGNPKSIKIQRHRGHRQVMLWARAMEGAGAGEGEGPRALK